jgi:4-alpha-glucanotransferase
VGHQLLSCLRSQAKLRISRAVFDQLGKADLESEGFHRFCADSWEWLQPYAVFCMLRRVFGTGEHWRWGALSQPTQEVRVQGMGWGPERCGTEPA